MRIISRTAIFAKAVPRGSGTTRSIRDRPAGPGVNQRSVMAGDEKRVRALRRGPIDRGTVRRRYIERALKQAFEGTLHEPVPIRLREILSDLKSSKDKRS